LVQRSIARFLIVQAWSKPDEAYGGTDVLIQCFGAAANLNTICIAWCRAACTVAVPTVRQCSAKRHPRVVLRPTTAWRDRATRIVNGSC